MKKKSPEPVLNFLIIIIYLSIFIVTGGIIFPLSIQAALPDNPVDVQIYGSKEPFNIIVVQKDIQELTVYSMNKELKILSRFPCSTGKAKGNKKIEGDAKTPTGVYFVTGEFLDKDLAKIYGTRAFPLDYPNALDKENRINGSAIWLHGTDKILQPYQTNGCVAMDNKNIDLLKSYIRFNRTPVIIISTLGKIGITRDTPWKTFLDKTMQNRKDSLVSGPYHAYLSLYHPDYLPDMTWWKPWTKLRSVFKNNTSFDVVTSNLLAVSTGEQIIVLFDQYLTFNGKKEFAGSIKLFFEPYGKLWRVAAEQYKQITDAKSKIKPQFPILIAGENLKAPTISKQEIASIVDSWLMAWSKKDIIRYESFYSKDFKSQKGQNLKQWIVYKKRLNKKYKYIKITRKGLQIRQDKNRLYVSFIQHYKNDYFSNKTKKTLILKIENKVWKIFRELV